MKTEFVVLRFVGGFWYNSKNDPILDTELEAALDVYGSIGFSIAGMTETRIILQRMVPEESEPEPDSRWLTDGNYAGGEL